MPDRLVVDLGGDGQATVLSWPDGGLPEEVSRAPLAWPLDADALEDLRWYLEDYLLAPFGVWEDRGPAVRAQAGRVGGGRCSGRCSAPGPARDAYQRARDRGLEVVFRSAEPGLLGLPWELMRDGAGPVALGDGRDLPEPAGRGRGGDAGGAGRAAAGADGDLPPGRDRRTWGTRWWPGRCWSGWTRSAARWTWRCCARRPSMRCARR